MQEVTTSAVATAAIPSQPAIVSYQVLTAAIAAWELQHREGGTRPAEEVAAMPIDQVAEESAAALWTMLADSGAAPFVQTPAIGQLWPEQGGIHVGQICGRDGRIEHLVLAVEAPTAGMSFAGAESWAKGLTVNGHADFKIPDRLESRLLFVQLGEQFAQDEAHWTSTQYSRYGAWFQGFGGGYQGYVAKQAKLRARAVRRFTP